MGHDPLTGLPDKAFFEARLEEAILRARSSGAGLIVLRLNLDRFAELNGILGRDLGDRVLREAALRLTRALAPCDSVARIGGDEFGALVEGTGELARATDLARGVLAQFGEPCVVDCLAIGVTASIGIALYPADGADAASLMDRADRALHKAKIAGRARSYPCSYPRDDFSPYPHCL